MAPFYYLSFAVESSAHGLNYFYLISDQMISQVKI